MSHHKGDCTNCEKWDNIEASLIRPVYTGYRKQTVCAVQYTLYSIHCTVYSVQYTVYSIQCTVYTVECGMYSAEGAKMGYYSSIYLHGHQQ